MNLLDIISLAKAGYKKSDIDELLSVQIDESENHDDSSKSMDEENPSESDGVDFPEESDETPDYEKLYNEIKNELEKVKIDLKTAQENNIRKDISDNDDDSLKNLEDVFRSFM